MTLFNDLLKNLTNSLIKKESFKEDIALILSKDLGVQIKSDDFSIKNGVLFLSASPTLKSAVVFKKDKIIKDLSSFGVKNIN